MTAASDGRAPQELFAFIDLKADTDCWLLLSFPLRAVSRFVIHTEIDIMNTGSQIAFQEKDKEEARAAIYFESCCRGCVSESEGTRLRDPLSGRFAKRKLTKRERLKIYELL
mmetsp:Transcript_31535/g.65864  ORF Transcript_31535/g.65864 Transcript_31535/m.65864 type:complete len:112 (-) Transcript_31535:444-779(-)